MNSKLNPEAPEFYPNFKSTTQDGYSKMKRMVSSARLMPVGPSYVQFKTFPDFHIVSKHLKEKVLQQLDQIMTVELPSVRMKCKDDEYNTEKVIDWNDSVLDRAHMHMDKILYPGTDVAPLIATLPAPIITKVHMGDTSLFGAKNILRPQITFRDVIDNSNNLWVPKISDKPNNLKPLSINIIYDDEGEPIGYEHPYFVEIDMYQPPAHVLVALPSPPTPPKPLEDTPLTMVETEEQLTRLLEHLATVNELAVDVEHHSYRTYQGITCLLQISTDEGGDFIVDTLSLRHCLHRLNDCFTHPGKLKVFHGADMDVQWLQRDLGVYVVGMFDTHQAARALSISPLSLASLLHRYCSVATDKRFQLADWRIRPLPDELIQYARADTHYLLYVWRCMREELLALDAGGTRHLRAVFEKSRQICGITYVKPVLNDDSHMPLYARSRKNFNTQQLAALKELYRWRDQQAREQDESTAYLLPNHMLLSLAENLPREVQGVAACCSHMPPFVKKNLFAIHRIIMSCREMSLQPTLYQMPAAVGAMVQARPRIKYQPHDLKQLNVHTKPEPTQHRCASLAHPDVSVFAKPSSFRMRQTNAFKFLSLTPYERYRFYRMLSQEDKVSDYRETDGTSVASGRRVAEAKPLGNAAPEKPATLAADPVTPATLDAELLKPVALDADQRKRRMANSANLDHERPNEMKRKNKRKNKNKSVYV